MHTDGVIPGVIYHSIRPQTCTDTATAFLNQPGQSLQDMEHWISRWCNTTFTFANLLAEAKRELPLEDVKARERFFHEHYIRILFKSSKTAGNGKWAIDAFYAGKRVDAMPKQNPYYKRDMTVDYLIDILFEDEHKNVLGGLIWCDLDKNLVSQIKQFSLMSRHLRLDADQLMHIMDQQADYRKTVLATRCARMRLDDGETGSLYDGRFIPDDPTKESFSVMIYSP